MGGIEMISQREVERRYNKMLKENTSALGDNRYCTYTCRCGASVRTVKLNSGTIPFTLNCPVCGKKAKSGGMVGADSTHIPNMGWKRPTLKETIKLRKKPQMLDHVLSGGLILTGIEPVKKKNEGRGKFIHRVPTINIFKDNEDKKI